VFVDDSTDGSDAVLAELAHAKPYVRLIHRPENRDGLAGAVVEGLQEGRGLYICVIDADLQHPPARIPVMLAAARTTNADIVIASRYVPAGSAGGLDGPLRQLYSHSLKRLTLLMFPRQLAGVTDPLGGYFLLRRSIVQDVALRPIGYKILLEILVRCRWETVVEVPYHFQPRQHGASKADFHQGMRFLHHLARLVWDRSPVFSVPRLAVGISFHEASAANRT
jgi:dolichol-phosphate mannosyltransferase